jgi:hypothetical protein
VTVTRDEERRPAGNGAAQQQVGETATSVDRARRRWRLHQVGTRRRIATAFEVVAGVQRPEPGTVDYARMGFTLGIEQRRAAGLALLDRERAA